MPTQEEIDRGDFLEDETAEETEEEATEEEGTEEPAGEEPEGSEGDDTEGSEGAEEDDSESDAGEVEEEEEPEPEPEEHMLPKSRYDSVQKRNRALQEKIERMENEREQMLANRKEPEAEDTTTNTRLSELDDEINDALLDGDKDKAKSLRAEQRELEHSVFTAELQETTRSVTIQAREQVRLDASVDFLEATYTELNTQSDDFDQVKVDELESLRHAFVASGDYSPSQALLKAANYVFPNMPEMPADAPAPKASKKDAIKKAVKARKKQPPDINGVGEDADAAGIKDEIDAMALTEKDFDALPEATLRRLRGDAV